MFTTSNGGIIDDCIVTRIGESSFYIVANAGRADVDLKHIQVGKKGFFVYTCTIHGILFMNIQMYMYK